MWADMAGNNDRMTILRLVDEVGKLCFGFCNVDLFDHEGNISTWSLLVKLMRKYLKSQVFHQCGPCRPEPEEYRAQRRHRIGRSGAEIRDREGHALSALGARRRPRHYPGELCAESAHGRTQTLGAARRQCGVYQPRCFAYVQRLLCVRTRARQEPHPPAPSVRGNDLRARRA